MLDNWVRELKLWCPSLKVVIYYGKVTQSLFSPRPHSCSNEVEVMLDVRFIILYFRINNYKKKCCYYKLLKNTEKLSSPFPQGLWRTVGTSSTTS